jgi:predicted secreted protein
MLNEVTVRRREGGQRWKLLGIFRGTGKSSSNTKFFRFQRHLQLKADKMAYPGKKLVLGILLIALTLCIVSQAGIASRCSEGSDPQAVSSAKPPSTVKVISMSEDKSLNQSRRSAIHDIIFKPEEGYVVGGKRIEPHDVIRAKLRQPFDIILDSNPTTGYAWTVDFDDRFLNGGAQLNGTLTIIRPALIGAGGQQIFRFTPIEPGQTIISAIYKRPWEETAAEERIFLIIIQDNDGA